MCEAWCGFLQEDEEEASTSHGVKHSEDNEWQEHDLAAFVGMKINDSSASAEGRAKPPWALPGVEKEESQSLIKTIY